MYKTNTNMDDLYESFRLLREAEEDLSKKDNGSNNTPDCVPYTAQDTLMTNTQSSAKQEFGADFNGIKNAMLYYPEDGDITFSGTIPQLNDAKFQFRYKDTSGVGCYVWINPIQLSDENLKIINKINGVFKNWKDEIAKSEDCKPSNYKDPYDQHPENQQGQVSDTQENEDDANNATQQDQQQPMQEHILRRGDDIVTNYNYSGLRKGDDLD